MLNMGAEKNIRRQMPPPPPEAVKSNVDGITHTVTDKITKMLKSTINGQGTNWTWPQWEWKPTASGLQNWALPSRPSYSATHLDPTHVMLIVIENKMVRYIWRPINLNVHEIGLLLFWVMNCKKLSKLQII